MFKAIENYSDPQAEPPKEPKMANKAVAEIHDDEDSKIIALMIKEYLEHYKMDYTLSVYLP